MRFGVDERGFTEVVPAKGDLLAKIKTLNEKVWERRATQPAVQAWLDNFLPEVGDGDQERLHALFVLSNFMFFGDREIRGLLRAAYRDLFRYPIVEKIRRNNGHTLDSSVIDPLFDVEQNRTRFLGMGNPSESGCHLLYYFRQENELPKELFIHTHQIFKRDSAGSSSLRNDDIKRYVFLDDFCGSGQQGAEYSREVVEQLKSLSPNCWVAYFVLFATERGIQRLKTQTSFDDVRAIYTLDSSFKCFGADSRYFVTPLNTDDRTSCEKLCRKYGERLVSSPPNALGFDDSQLLIGFHHNVPDNTLPIIWFNQPDSSPWVPIFRRYPKMGMKISP
jgi:hypothetical protein